MCNHLNSITCTDLPLTYTSLAFALACTDTHRYRKAALKLHPDKLGRERTAFDQMRFDQLQTAYVNLQGQEQPKLYLLAPSHAAFEFAKAIVARSMVAAAGKDSGDDSDGEVSSKEKLRRKPFPIRGNAAHASTTQKMKSMTSTQKKVMQVVMTSEREAEAEQGRTKRLTSGKPNRCSMPRVTEQTQQVSDE